MKNYKALSLTAIIILLAILMFGGKDKAFDLFFTWYTENGPLTLDEAKLTVPPPLHYSTLKFEDKQLDPIYYYFDYGAEKIIKTYFTTKDFTGQRSRVALLKTYHLLNPSVRISRAEPLTITWAVREIGQPCEISDYVYKEESLTGAPYQTCLVWSDNDKDYIFYSVWPEDESLRFVNSLVEIE